MSGRFDSVTYDGWRSARSPKECRRWRDIKAPVGPQLRLHIQQSPVALPFYSPLLRLLLGSSTAAREVCWRQQAHGFHTPQLFGRGVNNTWKRRRKAGKIRGEAGHTLKEWPVYIHTTAAELLLCIVQTFDYLDISVGVSGIQKPVNTSFMIHRVG